MVVFCCSCGIVLVESQFRILNVINLLWLLQKITLATLIDHDSFDLIWVWLVLGVRIVDIDSRKRIHVLDAPDHSIVRVLLLDCVIFDILLLVFFFFSKKGYLIFIWYIILILCFNMFIFLNWFTITLGYAHFGILSQKSVLIHWKAMSCIWLDHYFFILVARFYFLIGPICWLIQLLLPLDRTLTFEILDGHIALSSAGSCRGRYALPVSILLGTI